MSAPEGADRVLSWNAKVGRDNKQVTDGLADLIDNTNPDVVCLQESMKYVKSIRDRFGDHWFVYAHDEWEESNMNPVMVRKKGHDKQQRGEGWNTVRTATVWTGPQGGTHKGRTWTFVKVKDLWVMSFHRCTGGHDQNKDAFMEEFDQVLKWVKNRGESPLLIIGDHNCGPKADFPGSSWRIKNKIDGAITNTDAGVCYAIKRGIPGTMVSKGAHGSDHPAILFKRES